MSKWIYRYLRGDGQQIDMGFYPSRKEAQRESDEHASFGAMTTGAIEVPDDYPLYNGDTPKRVRAKK